MGTSDKQAVMTMEELMVPQACNGRRGADYRGRVYEEAFGREGELSGSASEDDDDKEPV